MRNSLKGVAFAALLCSCSMVHVSDTRICLRKHLAGLTSVALFDFTWQSTIKVVSIVFL